MSSSNKETALTSKDLLAKIYDNVEKAVELTEFDWLLNQPPKKEWIKVHPISKKKYIPIEKVEYLLTAIYLKWKFKIVSVQCIANSIVLYGTLYVLNPITNEWDENDGVGAEPIQTEKGASSTDFSKIKSAAVQLAAPASESYAIKDAAEKFGKIFGKDLNRDDVVEITPVFENRLASLNDKLKTLNINNK